MLSIDNTYSLEELARFGERVDKLLDGEPIEWVVELKIDGVAVGSSTRTADSFKRAPAATAASATTSPTTSAPCSAFRCGYLATMCPQCSKSAAKST